MGDSEATSLYQLWLNTDPLVPGVSYVIVFSGGALAAILSPEFAMLLVIGYVLLAAGVKIGSNSSVEGNDTNA